jgi:hypothetical protein
MVRVVQMSAMRKSRDSIWNCGESPVWAVRVTVAELVMAGFY